MVCGCPSPMPIFTGFILSSAFWSLKNMKIYIIYLEVIYFCYWLSGFEFLLCCWTSNNPGSGYISIWTHQGTINTVHVLLNSSIRVENNQRCKLANNSNQ